MRLFDKVVCRDGCNGWDWEIRDYVASILMFVLGPCSLVGTGPWSFVDVISS